MKRLFSLFVLLTLLMLTSAFAESVTPPTLYEIPATSRSSTDRLSVSLFCNTPYIIAGNTYTFTFKVSGGTPPYQLDPTIYSYPIDTFDPNSSKRELFATPSLDSNNTFRVTFPLELASYSCYVRVQDSTADVSLASFDIDAILPGQEDDPTIVMGKVNQIVSECITDEMGEYTRAKLLFDWLRNNAVYDYTFTYYKPDGVLLHGTGICQSYAEAYQLLLTAAGVESMIVVGTGNGDAHGWNLAKLDGSWYHIDSTWGSKYFALSDEEMAKDHDWNREDYPATADVSLSGARYTEYYDCLYTSNAAIDAYFQAEILPKRRNTFVIRYDGVVNEDDSVFTDWYYATRSQLYEQGLISSIQYSDSSSAISAKRVNITWKETRPYAVIQQDVTRMCIGDSCTLYLYDTSAGLTGYTWQSSDPSVATVDQRLVTAHSAGTATISIVLDGVVLDTSTIIVEDQLKPDFDLQLTETTSGVTLSWTPILGVPSYRVIRLYDGKEIVLTTIANGTVSAAIPAASLPADKAQMLYVEGFRSIDGQDTLTYRSERIPYGSVDTAFAAVTPANLTRIEASAFAGDSSLTTLRVTENVQAIGSQAFADCTHLSIVQIPASVHTISDDAFSGCTALKCAIVDPGSCAESYFEQRFPMLTLLYPTP